MKNPAAKLHSRGKDTIFFHDTQISPSHASVSGVYKKMGGAPVWRPSRGYGELNELVSQSTGFFEVAAQVI